MFPNNGNNLSPHQVQHNLLLQQQQQQQQLQQLQFQLQLQQQQQQPQHHHLQQPQQQQHQPQLQSQQPPQSPHHAINTQTLAGAAAFFPNLEQPTVPSYQAPSTSSSTLPPSEFQVVWQGHWYEGGADAMEVDRDRMQNRELKLSASSLLQLTELIHQHFPTSPEQPISLTTDDQVPLTEGEFEKLRRKRNPVVLVFEPRPGDKNSESIRWQWSTSFQHVPHPSIVTYSQELIAEEGRGANNVLAYALAEFIDNSISAIRKFAKQAQRVVPRDYGTIKVLILEHIKAKTYSIVIEDDGCGMNGETLQAFSRMGDAPTHRGEVRENVDADADNNFLNINISQWGIGAKSAGFFIGETIVVSSRPEGLKQVIECSMSQKKMFEEHQKTGNAFNDEMSRRAVAKVEDYPPLKQGHLIHPYLRELIREELDEKHKSHFTRVVVTGIEERHIPKLSQPDGVLEIVKELANIYNRFLFGPLGSNCPDQNASKIWMSPNIMVQHILELDQTNSGGRMFRTKHQWKLKEMKENETYQFQQMRQGPIFRFEMLVKVNFPTTHSMESLRGRDNVAKLRGEIYYLPRSVDGETHLGLKKTGNEEEDPRSNQLVHLRTKPRGAGSRAAAALAPTPAAVAATRLNAQGLPTMVDSVDADGNIISSDEGALDIFDIYWHGRLIPLSHVSKLNFMKVTPDNKDCLRRMKGYLFLAFPFLTSRNKLTVQERNLTDYLNGKDRIVSIETLDDNGYPFQHQLSSNRVEARWKNCIAEWKSLDANYTWDEKFKLVDASLKEGKELYSQVSIHGAANADFKVLTAGKIYKVWNKNQKNPSKPQWIEAMWFEKEVVPFAAAVVVASEFGGSGKIWGTIMPREGSNSGILVKSLRMVEKDTPLAEQKKEYEQHKAVVMAGEPHHIEVWMEPHHRLKDGDEFHKTSDWCFPGTAIAAFGHMHPTDRVFKALSGERVNLNVNHYAKEFQGEEVATKGGRLKKGGVFVKPPQRTTGSSSTATTAQPKKKAKTSTTTSRDVDDSSGHDSEDVEYTAPPSNKQSRTARPKQIRRAGAGNNVNQMHDDSDEEEEKKNDDTSDEDEPMLIIPQQPVDPDATNLFNDVAPTMSRDVAEGVSRGAEVKISNNRNEADVAAAAAADAAAASSAVSGKKRKSTTAEASAFLGKNGFIPFDFMHHTLCGRFQFTFSLEDWTIDKRFISRQHVAPVRCQVFLTPALPSSITLAQVRGADPVLDLPLNSHDYSSTIGFHLEDKYKNVWNFPNLRGNMDLCGIQVCSITTSVAELIAQCEPALGWDPDKKHWYLRKLLLTLPEDSVSPLNFKDARDRIDVTVTLKFDRNANYKFDPPPSQEALHKLRNMAVSFKVKLGPGSATDFMFENTDALLKLGSWNAISLENYSYLEGLSMHCADAWRHRTVGSPDMQISVHAALLFLPQTSFTSDHDVLTDSGWKPIRSIREGDNVWALQDPDTKNLKQQWTTVVSVKQSPAPATLYRTAESNHWGLLVANAHVLDGTASIEEPRGAHQHVYSLTTTARNFYVRRHAEIGAEQHWSGIFTGESDFREFHFPLPSLPTPKLYDLDRFGAVQFERVLLALPPELFSTHCVEVDAGHPVVEFNVLVQLRFKDEPDKPHSIRTMRVTVKPRWGPIKLGLFPDNSHLQNIHKHFDLDNIPTLKLSGIANEEIHNLHIAFFQESGFILPVKTFIQGIQPRHKQVHLFFDTLEGASTHITLADLNEDGKIESGLNLPSIISSSAAQNENSMEESVSKTSVSDFLMEVIDAKEPVEETEIEEKETEDVEMVDATAATSSTPTLRRSKRKLAEAKPKLSDVLPFAKLSTAFQITVSPAPPVRWALSTSFPRGFKTGLVWSSYVRMFLVDQFGNRTAVPQLAEGQEIKIEMQVHSAPPEKETNLPAAAITATAMDIEGAPVSTQPSSASSGPGAAAVVPSSSTLVDPTSLKSWHPSRAKRTDNTLADYFSAPPAFLVVKAGSYWLVVSDKFSLFKPSHSVAVQLQAGAPHRIRAFTSDKCTDADEVGYPTSDLTLASKSNPIYCFSKGKIDRLWVKFFDRGGNETICNQTVELQLVLPKDANTSASAASASAAPQIEGGATTTAAPPAESSQPGASVRVKPEPADVDMQDGSRKEGESVQDDATVSGIYAYPLFQTRPAHQSIFQRTDASGHAIPMSRNSLVPVKDEYVPLTNLTGALKNSAAHAAAPATAFVLLEEFTLHLNAKHFRGSSLLIQAREVNKAAANNPTNKSKKPLKAIKNDIVIALEVKPFVQGVTGVRVASVFDGLRVQQLLQAKPTELSLRAELTATPSIFRFKSKARNAADAETENDGDSILSSAVAAAVPAGTPFPLIQVDLVINGVVGGGLSTTSSQQSHEAPFSPRVKPEPTEVIVPCSATSSSQSGSQESSYLLPFLSEGLSIEVFVLPRGLNDPSERKAVNNLYQRARYDHARGKFVFEPIRTEVLQQLEGANAVSQDAVARTEDYVFDCTGDWLFLVRWLEPREYISNVLLPTECEHVAHGVQKVANGQPTTMSLAISRGEQNAASGTEIVVSNVDVNPAAASHQITGPRASRLIAREVSIKLFDHFNNLVPLDTLSAESVNVFKQMRWKVTAENEKPLPPPPTPVARPSASPGKPSRAEIIVIDSDDEEAQDVVPAPVPPPAAVIEPPPSTAASARVIPQITMSAGEFDLANSALVFRDVCVQPQSAGESGKYSLHFILPRPYDEELSASLDFYFSNDVLAQEKLMEQLQRKRAAVSKVEKIHAAKMQEIVSTQEKLTALERSNSALRQRMDISTRTIGAVVAKLERLSIKVPSYVASSVEALHRFVQEQNVALRNVQSSQNVHVMQAKVEAFPATVSLLPPTLTKAGGYHGRVVELASISDLKLCALISWHTQHMLSTFVTSDRSCVADRDLRTWCRNNRIGQVSDLAGQNPNPFNANQLPHEFVRHNPNVPPYVPRGNPRYLVNCLDFYTSVPYERHLYQSLFQNLFGKVLIMDSMAEAVDYRSYLVQQKHICPSILVLKELKLLPSNNVERFDDRAYARGLNSLANHFEVRPRSAIQGSSAMLLHEQLEQITQLLTLLPQVEQEQQKTNHEIASLDFQTQFQQLSVKMMQLKAERMQLENQLKSLGVDPRAQRLVSGNQSHDGGAASSSSSAAGSAAAAAASSAARPSPASSSSLVAQSSQNELDRRRARNAAMLEEQRDREKQRNRR